MKQTQPMKRRRPPWRRIGIALAVALAVWLAVDKTISVVNPSPTVGHWKSAEGRDAYATAYRDVMSELPTPSRTEDVVTGFGSVRVLVWEGSEAGPPVVLLPGHSSGAPMWAENLPHWIGHRTVYAIDPLGDAGFSVQSVPLTGFEDQAHWIADTLEALAIPRAHVVGHSFGGANAAILAVEYPQLVASLTLMEPVLVIEPLPASAFFWATLTQLPVPQSIKDRALAEVGGTTVEEVRERTPMSRMIDAAAEHYATATPLPRQLDDAEWRSLAELPVRVDIAGTKSLSGAEDAVDRMRSLLPNADLQLWPDATHSLPMQKRDEIGPALLEFWRAHS